jgi:hypothetical protein
MANAPVALPLINGRRYQFASIEMSVLKPNGSSEIFIEFSDITYKDSLAIEFVRGTNQAPIGWTDGEYEADDTVVTFYKSALQRLIDAVGSGYMGANFVITVKYSANGEPLTVDVITCRLSGLSDSPSKGPDPLAVEATFKTMLITRNGNTPLAGQLA